MGNVIHDRIIFFLREHPPFSYLSSSQLDQVTSQITVNYAEDGALIFRQGEEGNGLAYILRKGNIQLFTHDQLVDQCEPGDIFGVRSILNNTRYVMSAKSVGESLVYSLPEPVFKEILENNSAFSLFFAHGYAAGQAVVRNASETELSAISELRSLDQPLNFTRDVLTCQADVSIRSAAEMMRERRCGSIVVVDSNQHPEGIVTDTDLRNKVIADGKSIALPISSIMSAPVYTISVQTNLSEALGIMIRSNIHHLIMTEDGTAQTRVAGMVSDHDIAMSQQNHPVALIKALKYADTKEKWKEIRDTADLLIEDYFDKGVNVDIISGLITTLNDLIIEKAYNEAIEKLGKGKSPVACWISLGSEGREEQLLRTDQDNAIIFEEGQDKSTILDVASYVNDVLLYCGFEKCPADIMARNPDHCLSLFEWKQRFNTWMFTPEPKALLHANIFFDFRPVAGNKALAEELASYLEEKATANELFLGHLAKNATLNPPPLGFFNQLLVEKSGEHKDQFDIKKRAMMPLSDAARILVLSHGHMNIQNTTARYLYLADKEPFNQALFSAAAAAYEICLKLRTRSGILNGDTGRYIDINGMNKLDKKSLRNVFSTISELQTLLKTRFQLSYFS